MSVSSAAGSVERNAEGSVPIRLYDTSQKVSAGSVSNERGNVSRRFARSDSTRRRGS